jgi:5-methylcytosine-specific restriction endonuclease McrA
MTTKATCVSCKVTAGKITKDHVIPRVVLRDLMSMSRRARFCSAARKLNLQPMCAPCNGRKAGRVIDFRVQRRRDELRALVKNWGLPVEFEDPDVFISEMQEAQ